DLAAHFSNGNLDEEGLMSCDDEELASKLIQVKGIGMWTIHMFQIFHLTRPDILPIGDLAFRRGAKRYFGLGEAAKVDCVSSR
ncbi:hypothetical protein HDU91_003760, partial [Kappamyces sp. JEL0680]